MKVCHAGHTAMDDEKARNWGTEEPGLWRGMAMVSGRVVQISDLGRSAPALHSPNASQLVGLAALVVVSLFAWCSGR